MHHTNLSYINLRQFSNRAFFPSTVIVMTSAFGIHIPRIVPNCAQEQMRGIHAKWVIACVANTHTFFN